MYDIQVGFASVSDYITYTWVKDDEVAFNEEDIQVVTCKKNNYRNFWTIERT